MSVQYIRASAAPNRVLSVSLWSIDMSTEYAIVTPSELIANSGLYLISILDVTPYSGDYRIVMTDTVTGYSLATWKVTFAGVDGEAVDAVEFTGAASGGASESKQDQIIAAITPITTVYSPQPSSEVISLIHGDAYDGQANNKLSWTSSKDVDGETVNFTIRDSKDAIVLDQSTAGVTTTATGTLVEVSLSTSATELLDPAATIYKFDVEIEFTADSRWTITRGTVCVEGDESR